MELPPHLELACEEAPAEAVLDALADGLEGFNEAAWPGHPAWRPFGLFLREHGRILGGLAAETYAGWMYVRYFWLSDALRGRGLGRGLLAAAEERARALDCHSAYLDTFSFQAPDFYRAQGYEEFGRLPYPPRGERIFLRKSLG